jgi:hypothetical protein
LQPPIHAEIAGQTDNPNGIEATPRRRARFVNDHAYRLIEHAVDLARHDEIVLVQSLDLL